MKRPKRLYVTEAFNTASVNPLTVAFPISDFKVDERYALVDIQVYVSSCRWQDGAGGATASGSHVPYKVRALNWNEVFDDVVLPNDREIFLPLNFAPGTALSAQVEFVYPTYFDSIANLFKQPTPLNNWQGSITFVLELIRDDY